METNREPIGEKLMIATLDTKKFEKQMNNIVEYSMGFLDGVKSGKKAMLDNIGVGTIEALKRYIDVNAKMNPKALHHVYEWYQTGKPEARLFNLTYTVSNLGLSVKSTFSQSKTISQGSTEPFYNKAKIMESGIPVHIEPKTGGVLAFEEGGETIFTKNPIDVRYPGGPEVVGSFEEIYDEFFSRYFTQAFLRSSGILDYLERPTAYKKNLKLGSIRGRDEGVKTGFTWVANAKIVGIHG